MTVSKVLLCELERRLKDLKEVIEELKNELHLFVKAFEGLDSKTMMNPFFGNLNFEEWTHLLHKHFEHHCRQFGLI